ncbi:HD domain-containing phosphohydrolase [Cellulosilyticum sp. I15G10I2]|uniref:HD domain-containing phosphohydrolase n=1 Tax=Cellulosilyticum sp. I15G10I2 TaxID=1892843 RepID=UPI00085C4F7C|nr:HD domain-containing phosphohydrolase [Cellulosilyticum sp. I15G10I2]
MIKISVKTKIICLIVFTIFTSNIFLGYLNYRDSESLAIDIIKEKNEEELMNISEYYFNKLIFDMEYVVNYWSESPDIIGYNKPSSTSKVVSYIPEDFEAIYEQWVGLTRSMHDITWLYYALESDGSIYVAPVDASMPLDYDARTRDWYQGTVQQAGEIFWTEPYLDAGDSGKILQTVSKAVYESGVLKGVIGVDIELEKFTEIINNLSFAKNANIFLVNQSNEVIAHNSSDIQFFTKNFIEKISQSSVTEIQEINRDKYIISWTPLSINNWKLIAITKTGFEADLREMKIRVFLIVLGTSLLSVLFAFFGSKNLLRPLNRLIIITKEVGRGNLNIRSVVRSNDEFGALSKSFNNMLEQINELMAERDQNYIKTVKALANAIEASDEYTRGHCDRVGIISKKLMKKLNLPERQRAQLEFACILHDIGKIGIPESVLNKVEKLTQEEYDLIKKHPVIGYDMIKEVEFLKESSEILLQHHERIDGKGYPYHLTDHQIRIEAKILAVADAYDAMSSFRIYRSDVLTDQEIVKELINSKGKQLDAHIVEALLELIRNNELEL